MILMSHNFNEKIVHKNQYLPCVVYVVFYFCSVVFFKVGVCCVNSPFVKDIEVGVVLHSNVGNPFFLNKIVLAF